MALWVSAGVLCLYLFLILTIQASKYKLISILDLNISSTCNQSNLFCHVGSVVVKIKSLL